jgi:FkbM family methyltransferase
MSGAVTPHGRLGPLLRRLARLPLLRRLRATPTVDRFTTAHYYAQSVDKVWRFVARELAAEGSVSTYRPRGAAFDVLVRHGTSDVNILAEVFMHRLYALPPEAESLLEGLGREPRIVDLGAHIGLFDVFLLTRFPRARITAFEPDAANARLLSRCAELSGRGERWRIVRAAAGTTDGKVPFAGGRFAESAVATSSAAATTEVPSVDIFPLLADADLVKIDIEGAEWPLLQDERLAEAGVKVLALEWHPSGCPSPDPEQAAIRLLTRAGYEVRPIANAPPGVGMLWGLRRETTDRGNVAAA